MLVKYSAELHSGTSSVLLAEDCHGILDEKPSDLQLFSRQRRGEAFAILTLDLLPSDGKGAWMFDETGFVKGGEEPMGVARQCCGILGKVENCHVGVWAVYASRHGYALVDRRLFLPEVWLTYAYASRRTRCNVPEVH
jgi:DDE superfamily endonuclease